MNATNATPAVVYVVHTEWNRPHDCDGASVIEGVGSTRETAEGIAESARAEYRAFGHKQFGDDSPGADDSAWDFDVQVQETTVF